MKVRTISTELYDTTGQVLETLFGQQGYRSQLAFLCTNSVNLSYKDFHQRVILSCRRRKIPKPETRPNVN